MALAIAAAAFGLRWRALHRLPVDYDEGWYLEAAQGIAGSLAAGDPGALTASNFRPEHPQLAKLVYGAAVLPALDERAPSLTRTSVGGGPSRLPEPQLVAARTAAAVLGALEVLLLASIQPLAGLFLAIHALTVKYTSLVMLEALPAFTSLAAVACWVRSKPASAPGWRLASAALLGVAAAGKYVYAVAGVAILADWILELRGRPGSLASRVRPVLLWGAASLLVFFAANPYLWPDPLGRLRDSLFYHADYSTGADVTSAGFPFWQPLAWLATWAPADVPAARPHGFRPDPLIALLALFGLDRLWRRQRVFALWLGIALLFLLVWNTKWPHYVLILTAPLCLAAAEGTQRLGALAARAFAALRGGARVRA